MSELQYPEMREELLGYLASLCDPDYQKRIWVDKKYPTSTFYDDLTMTLRLLEDLGVLRDPRIRLGVILKSESEVEALARLGRALDVVFSLYGTELSDTEYLAVPEWQEIILSARRAYETILAGNSEGLLTGTTTD
jgi:hypothetical protein